MSVAGSVAASAARAVAESVVAGLIVGVVEAVAVIAAMAAPSAGDAAATTWVVAGLVCLGAALVGPLAIGLAILAARTGPLRAWRAGWAADGAARVVAVVHAAVAGLAMALFGAVVWAAAGTAHERFHAAGAIAILEAALFPLVAAAIALAAIELGRPAGRRAAGWTRPARWLAGTRGAVVVAAFLGVAGAGAILVGRMLIPAFEWGRPAAALGFLGALAVVRLASAHRARLRRAFPIAGAAIGAAALAVLAVLPRVPAARAAVVAHGQASESALRSLWNAVDRDGDGYPPRWIGGTDCDDGDRRRHPGSDEVLDNGIDENCSGADFSSAELAHRKGKRPSTTAGARRHNVVLITIDALRPDHLGVAGYRRPTSPAIDLLAARSVRFTDAMTSSPVTRRAIPSLMTGRYPSAIAWQRGKVRLDPKTATTLGTTLRARGYATAAISCCERLFGEESGGVLAGIDHIDDSADAIRKSRADRYNGDAVADRVVAWIAGRTGDRHPFFLWTHLIDAHNPYRQLPGAPVFGTRSIDRYDAEIAFVDAQVARILAAIDDAGLTDSTIVVLTADHGEEFGEHGVRYHGKSLGAGGVRIPLIVAYPGGAPRVIDGPVSIVDVMPTVLDLVGVEGPAGMNGLSLAGSIASDGPVPTRPLLAELIPDYETKRSLIALYDGGYKLLWDRDADTWHLWSTTGDPGEKHDLAADRGDLVEQLRDTLGTVTDAELSPLE